MNEFEFEEFIAMCTEELRCKNAALEDEHGLGSFARWDHDADTATLTFSNPGDESVLRATTSDIGSYSLKTKTWLWAWANESHTDAEREKASTLKRLFSRTGMRVFSDPHFDCDEYLAWELAAASVHLYGSIGCYRAPIDHLWIFWSIDSVASVRREQ